MRHVNKIHQENRGCTGMVLILGFLATNLVAGGDYLALANILGQAGPQACGNRSHIGKLVECDI